MMGLGSRMRFTVTGGLGLRWRFQHKLLIIKVLFLTSALPGCAYRFTNLRFSPPAGVKKIAVEALYDVSREVLPHDILWVELQREIAKTGKVVVGSVQNSEAIMRVKLAGAGLTPVDSVPIQSATRYPQLKDPLPTTLEQLDKADILDMAKATKRGSKEALAIALEVEVWSLTSRKLLFKRRYAGSGEVESVTLDANGSGYLKYEEKIARRFQQLAKTLSRKIVSDFLLSGGY